MWDKPRILPILALAAGALLVLKCMSLFTDLGSALETITPARAADHGAAAESNGEGAAIPPAPEEKAAEPAPASEPAAQSEGEKATLPAAEAAPAPAAQNGNASEPASPAAADAASPAGEGLQYTRAEVEVLQNLSARRAELDKRARELDLKEKLLSASEQRVSERIAELKSIETNIQTLLAARKDAEEGQIKSLVKVYENMKPKDAARIFEELEMDILLPVAQRMKEAKFALILAQMNPEKAKRLTVGLAKQLELPEQKAPEQKS
jgi:flagellar motility protein MotE (MotC chaperone)